MDKQSQHIVFGSEGSHIVGKRAGIDAYRIPCQHFHHGVFQTVHVHLDIDFERFIGFGLVPVGAELVPQHCLDYGFRTVHGIMHIARPSMSNQLIAVIPCPCFLEVHLIFFAECLDLLLGKTEIRCQFTGVSH